MKTRTIGLGIACWLAAIGCGRAALLDGVIRRPGPWNQMCAMDVNDGLTPKPFFTLTYHREFFLDKANIATMHDRRSEVVPDIVQRLDRLGVATSLFGEGGRRDVTALGGVQDSGIDPNKLSGLLLEIIVELRAVETLPSLLRLDEELNQALQSAASNPVWRYFVADGTNYVVATNSNPPLNATGKTPVIDVPAPAGSGAPPVHYSVLMLRLYQREMLSTMAILLRDNQFQVPALTAIGTRYTDYMTEQARQPGRRIVWSLEGEVPYSPELRGEIRKLAADYVRQSSTDRAAAAHPAAP
jgi:hypothetical protein